MIPANNVFLNCSYCYNDYLHPSVQESVATAKQLFPNGGVALLSNSAGSEDDEDYRMAERQEKSTGIPIIRHVVKKPGCLEEVLDHFEKSMKTKIKPSEICCIGRKIVLCSLSLTHSNYYRDHHLQVIGYSQM
jgi:phosphatidylglycerophosphatase GEP4